MKLEFIALVGFSILALTPNIGNAGNLAKQGLADPVVTEPVASKQGNLCRELLLAKRDLGISQDTRRAIMAEYKNTCDEDQKVVDVENEDPPAKPKPETKPEEPPRECRGGAECEPNSEIDPQGHKEWQKDRNDDLSGPH